MTHFKADDQQREYDYEELQALNAKLLKVLEVVALEQCSYCRRGAPFTEHGHHALLKGRTTWCRAYQTRAIIAEAKEAVDHA